MTPRQVSKDQRRLNEKTEKERIEKEVIETAEGSENKRKRNGTRESLFVNVFSSTVCDVILQEQKDKHVKEIHELPCLKRKLVRSALSGVHKKQIRQTQHMELFIVTYQGGILLSRNVIDGLQPLESNKYQVEFDPRRRELVSTCEKIKFLHKIVIKTYFKTSVLRFGTNLLEEGGYDVNCIWVKWRMTNAPC